MQIAPIDIALLLVAVVAGSYCFLLNKRLKALQDTREGMGATIQALSDTISKMNGVTEASGQQARAMAEALDLQMRQTKTLSERMERLVADGQRTTTQLADQLARLDERQASSAFLFDDAPSDEPPLGTYRPRPTQYGYDDEK